MKNFNIVMLIFLFSFVCKDSFAPSTSFNTKAKSSVDGIDSNNGISNQNNNDSDQIDSNNDRSNQNRTLPHRFVRREGTIDANDIRDNNQNSALTTSTGAAVHSVALVQPVSQSFQGRTLSVPTTTFSPKHVKTKKDIGDANATGLHGANNQNSAATSTRPATIQMTFDKNQSLGSFQNKGVFAPFEIKESPDYMKNKMINDALSRMQYGKKYLYYKADIKTAYKRLSEDPLRLERYQEIFKNKYPDSKITDQSILDTLENDYNLLREVFDLKNTDRLLEPLLPIYRKIYSGGFLDIDEDDMLFNLEKADDDVVNNILNLCLYGLGFQLQEVVTIADIIKRVDLINSDYQAGKIPKVFFDQYIYYARMFELLQQSERIPGQFIVGYLTYK